MANAFLANLGHLIFEMFCGQSMDHPDGAFFGASVFILE
jgi:hypothetical protein